MAGKTAAKREVSFTRALATGKTTLSAEEVVTHVTTVRSEAERAATAASTLMWDAACLTSRLTRTEMIGKGKGEIGGFDSQRAYASALGVAESYVSRFVRLGVAVADFGVTYGSREWTFLASRASDGKVSKVLKGKPDDLHDYAGNATNDAGSYSGKRLLSVWAAEFAAGTYTPGDTRAAITAGDGTATPEAPGEEGGAAEVVETREPTPAEILSALDKVVKGLSDEDWAAVETRMGAIITREVTVRTKRAAAAAKAAATA